MDAAALMPPPPAAATTTADQPVWVLLGSKSGDNSQMLALAQALGLPYRCIQLRFNGLHWLLPFMLGRSLASVKNRAELCQGPWPQLVISSGLRSVAAARWLQRQSQQRARLVHIGRPWGPFHWFDLIVTTPQYALPMAGNIHHNLLPLLADEPLGTTPLTKLPPELCALPRPWTIVLLGGHSRPLRFTVEAASTLAAGLNTCEGSVFVLGSPRTPPLCIETMRPLLKVPHAIFPFGEGENPYATLGIQADRFVVTADSVQMAAELLVCGKPVEVFPLPESPDLLVRLTRLWRDAARRSRWLRPPFDWARNHGLLSSLRDISLFHQQLDAAGVYARPEQARQLRAAEKTVTVHRIQRLLNAADSTVAASDTSVLIAPVQPQALHQP